MHGPGRRALRRPVAPGSLLWPASCAYLSAGWDCLGVLRQMARVRFQWVMVVGAAAVLVGCDQTEDNYPIPAEPHERTTYTNDKPADTVFGPGGLNLFGGDKKNQGNGEGGGIGVNAYLWRATLDTVSFLPLASADPFGGVIITDWYTTPASPDERLKVTAYIMDRNLRADGLRLVVFRQTRANGVWSDAAPNPETARQLENVVLTKARELRLATLSASGK